MADPLDLNAPPSDAEIAQDITNNMVNHGNVYDTTVEITELDRLAAKQCAPAAYATASNPNDPWRNATNIELTPQELKCVIETRQRVLNMIAADEIMNDSSEVFSPATHRFLNNTDLTRAK